MNIKNLLTLTVRVEDFNLVARKPDLLKKLRVLTLCEGSGMNHELDNLERLVKIKTVKCKVLLAYRTKQLVGWALLSDEPTDFYFSSRSDGYHGNEGTLFQVFVHPEHRRQGIASELIKKAKRQTKKPTLCICPWDFASYGFYDKCTSIQTKIL